jgi:chromosome partitioning protein
MKIIAVNSIKGGSGKSTLTAVLLNALSRAGYRCLAIDADASNNSLSFYFDDLAELEQEKTIFNLFMGDPIQDCAKRINNRLDLIRGDVRLNEFRSTDSLKKLKRSLQGLDYDFVIIDTSPTYDNIIGNVLTASDILLIPVQQDLFTYQALRYQFEKLTDLELDNLDTHIIFNQYEKPLTENQSAYRNQITNLFLENETFKSFINPNRISRSSTFRKYINKDHYRIDGKIETMKVYEEIKSLIKSILDIDILEGF